MTTITPINSPSATGGEAHDHHSEHGEHPDLRMFGLATFLVADAMTFAGFFAAYLTFRAVNPLPPGAIYELEMVLPVINTSILIASSFTFHRASKELMRGAMGACRGWLLLTAVMGMAFLGGQMKEYFELPFGLTDNLFASTFYALTGFHGLHVCLGALMILIVWVQAAQPGKFTPQQHFGIAAAELYWHFVDVIWVILFALLYLL